VTFVVFLHNWWYKNPHVDKPMINYDLALLMAPAGVLGSTWGVVLNSYLSDYIILICMIIIMLLSFYLTLKRAILMRRKEKKERKEFGGEVQSEGNNPNPDHCFDFCFGKDDDENTNPDEAEASEYVTSPPGSPIPIDGGEDKDIDLEASSARPKKAELTKDEKKVLKIQKYEARIAPGEKYFLLLLMIVGNVMILIAAGPKTQSIWGVYCGSPLYWAIMSLTFPYLLGIVLLTAIALWNYEKLKIRINFPWHVSEVHWTPFNLFYFPVIDSFVVGIVAGFFGIGGGVLQTPLLLELGVIAWEASSTSQFVVLITSISGTCQNIANGNLQWQWALWFAGFNAIAALIGKQLMDRTVRYFKLQSLLVFFLAGVIAITLVALIYSGASRIAAGQGGWGLKQYCRAVNGTNSTNATFLNTTKRFLFGLDNSPYLGYELDWLEFD